MNHPPSLISRQERLQPHGTVSIKARPSTSHRPKALYAMESWAFDQIYKVQARKEISKLTDIPALRQTASSLENNPAQLAEVEIIFTGWSCPRLDERFLRAAPHLRAVFYGAGTIRQVVTDAFWKRNILITNAVVANGIPVSEYTLAQILFCLKRGWQTALHYRKQRRFTELPPVSGGYHSTVGLVALGVIGRKVCKLLQPFDLSVIAHDPYVSAKEALDLGVELRSLPELFAQSDVVSLHLPWLPKTEKVITRDLVASMKNGATLINTARGAIIDEPGMIDVLEKRPDLFAVLDVTYPELPEPESPLWTLPNVLMTPHMAGSRDKECYRMGDYMVDELRRYLEGRPLQFQIDAQRAELMA